MFPLLLGYSILIFLPTLKIQKHRFMGSGRGWRIHSKDSPNRGSSCLYLMLPLGRLRSLVTLTYHEALQQEALLCLKQPFLTWDRCVYKRPFPFIKLTPFCLRAATVIPVCSLEAHRVNLIFLPASGRQDVSIFIYSSQAPCTGLALSWCSDFYLIH